MIEARLNLVVQSNEHVDLAISVVETRGDFALERGADALGDGLQVEAEIDELSPIEVDQDLGIPGAKMLQPR